MDSNNKRIAEIEEQLSKLPIGTVVYKTINGKKQPYLQWNEHGKTKSKYIKQDTRDEVLQKVEIRRALMAELKELKSTSQIVEPTITSSSFKTNVITGSELDLITSEVKNYEKRFCYGSLAAFLKQKTNGRVCLLYGLRRTGKTTLLFQAIRNLTKEEQRKSAYIKARINQTMADIDADMKELHRLGYRFIFIDEVTLLKDFIDSASLFSDIYAMMGMKIVLSGTDSLGFWFTLTQELYDRAFGIHTTYIPFREYSYLLGIDDIDEYIRYGGTLRPGELAFDDPDAITFDASFRDDESTRRYIDTAICNNIQHSLECCKNGNYFRHLRSLYEAGELTNAINRTIESMNHKFLLRVLIKNFKSGDFGSAAELLRKQPDEEKRTDILDKIDQDKITKKLMSILQIKDQEDMKIGITQAHVSEIKEYLSALDLIVDCPSENLSGEPDEYVLFTQPGMRYCQAQALVYVLMKDNEFNSFSEKEKKLVCDKILENVRGRMMEDIVLLDTSRVLDNNSRAFKLVMSRSEFDMVVYRNDSNTCEAYEIKHSAEIVPRQYHVLDDKEQCKQVEKKYGKISSKCVIYRGRDTELDNGIKYMNVEKFLKN